MTFWQVTCVQTVTLTPTKKPNQPTLKLVPVCDSSWGFTQKRLSLQIGSHRPKKPLSSQAQLGEPMTLSWFLPRAWVTPEQPHDTKALPQAAWRLTETVPHPNHSLISCIVAPQDHVQQKQGLGTMAHSELMVALCRWSQPLYLFYLTD